MIGNAFPEPTKSHRVFTIHSKISRSCQERKIFSKAVISDFSFKIHVRHNFFQKLTTFQEAVGRYFGRKFLSHLYFPVKHCEHNLRKVIVYIAPKFPRCLVFNSWIHG